MDKVHLYRWVAGMIVIYLTVPHILLFHEGLLPLLMMFTIGAYFYGFILNMIYSKVFRPIWNFIKGGEE